MIRRSTAFLTFAAGLSIPWIARAQGALITNSADMPDCDFVKGQFKAACVPEFIGHLIAFVFQFISVLFVINIIIAGYQLAIAYSTSGDKGAGWSRMRYSIIGLIVSVCCFLILDFVITTVLS